MLYNITESLIDSDGCQYICGLLEAPKFNDRNLWHNIKAFDIHLNHKKQVSVLSTFDWINGAPCNFKEIKRIKNEIVDVSEVERLLYEAGILSIGG